MSKNMPICLLILCIILCVGCNTLQRTNVNDPGSPLYGAPSIPTGLTASTGDTTVTLSWSAVDVADMSGYNIYRSTSSGTDFSKINSSTITSLTYADSGLTNGTTYYYKIASLDTSGNESGYCDEISAIPAVPPAAPAPPAPPDTTAPATPTGLTAIKGDGQVTLSWTANTESDIAGYNVYTYSSYTYVKLNSSLITGASVNITGCTNGTTYYYKISAVDTSGNESAQTSSVSCTPSETTPPAAPSGLTAVAPYTGTSYSYMFEIDLSWYVNTESDLAGYNIYRSTSSGGSYGRINTSLVSKYSRTYDDTYLADTTYYYKITAVDSWGNESSFSSVVSSHSHK